MTGKAVAILLTVFVGLALLYLWAAPWVALWLITVVLTIAPME